MIQGAFLAVVKRSQEWVMGIVFEVGMIAHLLMFGGAMRCIIRCCTVFIQREHKYCNYG
jgi:hypothetical protein